VESQAGEAWRSFYQKGSLSWCNPEAIERRDFLHWSRSEWITRILDASGLQPSREVRILEAGCGTGMYAITMALMGFSVDAFDYNEEAVQIARDLSQRVEPTRNGLSIHFYRDNLLNMRSASDTYDLVFNQSVLEYFCDEVEHTKALSEMIRVAKPGGWVGVIVQHTGHPFRGGWERMGWPGYVDQPPVIIYTPRRLAQQLETAGLSEVCVDGIYPWKALFFWPPWYKRWDWVRNLVYILLQVMNKGLPMPRLLRSRLALQILGVGRKR
jgi:SAM-dependent methyltransferase